MQKYPEAIYKTYFSVPDLLDGVRALFLDGGVLENLEAIPYLKNLYRDLTIQEPLTDFGIRFVCLKEKEKVLKIFEDALEDEKDLSKLKAKWDLTYP
jgi:hypothetical protein